MDFCMGWVPEVQQSTTGTELLDQCRPLPGCVFRFVRSDNVRHTGRVGRWNEYSRGIKDLSHELNQCLRHGTIGSGRYKRAAPFKIDINGMAYLGGVAKGFGASVNDIIRVTVHARKPRAVIVASVDGAGQIRGLSCTRTETWIENSRFIS